MSGFALAIVCALFVAFLAVLPVCNVRLPQVPAFLPTAGAIMLLGELILATQLYGQAALFRSQALIWLASGYVFAALLLIPYALTFPGAFASGGLLHPGVSTTAWLMIFRRCADPLAVIAYALLKTSGPPPPRAAPFAPPLVCMSVAAALAGAITLLAIRGQDLLPPMFVNPTDGYRFNLRIFNLSNIVLVVIAMGMLLKRRTSILDTWLLVSLSAAPIGSMLNMPNQGRFTVGWYSLILLMVFSHLVVLLALIGEANRLYIRLALAAAARSRERDARLMSVDGVAAAMSREIGQPLTAVSLAANAALSSLDRERPDPGTAIRSLRDTLQATQRAFAIVKSQRATYRRKARSLTEFDINDLLRETTSLLEREMAAQRISLALALDETLPPVLADRLQIQRVVVNLLANAIESIAATEGGPRRIVVRSQAADHSAVGVEISDSGAGIAPEHMARIFEPFFTTKATGTGLGLMLSRNIVEDHGGRLSASHSEGGGAMFRLELQHGAGLTQRSLDAAG